MFTCEPVPAEELHGYGSINQIVPEAELASAARSLAETIAAKPPRVVRAAKKAINSSVGRRIRELYRQELSWTYELNLSGDAYAARDTFVTGTRQGYLS
jgi:enoyl-CoA hydratase